MGDGRPVVPLVDLRAALVPIRDALRREIDGVLERMDLLLGPHVQAFEQEFTAHCDAAHGVAVSNGTDALVAALRACGIGPGDEVIAPAHTFFATIEAIVHCGATPVMVDVEPDTLTIDADQVRSAVTPATRAIVPVHLYGHPADMRSIGAIAEEHGLRVIEDAAQAHGARYRGRRCGSLGDAAAFSFYFTKNLGAIGEAGFVTARDPAVAETLRLLRHHGHASKYEHVLCGSNLRMDELQAVVLRLKLPRLDAANQRRRAIATRYGAYFEDIPVELLRPRADCEPVYHLFPIRIEERDALRDWLTECGIQTGIHYPIPAHRQPALQRHAHRQGAMTVTERACRQLLSLPIYPELSDAQVDYVATSVRQFFTRERGVASGGKLP